MSRLLESDLLLLDEAARVERLAVLEGPTGRRHWPDEEKARIVLESFRTGVKVGDVARRNGIPPQQLSTWRRLARDGKLPMPLLPEEEFAALEIAKPAAVTEPACPDHIEIVVDGMSVRVPGATAAFRIGEIARALRGA
ncbi:MAG: transposase [Pseudomonadota bacterium]